MKYFLTHNKIDVFHYGKIEENQILKSGQPFIEYFESDSFLKDRLKELGYNYTDNINNEYTYIPDGHSDEPIT